MLENIHAYQALSWCCWTIYQVWSPHEWTRNGINLLFSSLTFLGRQSTCWMWRKWYLSALCQRWTPGGGIPKWHLEMLSCVTSLVRAHLKYWWEAHLIQLPFLLSCWWFEGSEKPKDMPSAVLLYRQAAPAFPLSLKPKSPLGVAHTVTQLEGSSEASGSSEWAQTSL